MENNKCSKLSHTHLQETGVVDRSQAKKGTLKWGDFPKLSQQLPEDLHPHYFPVSPIIRRYFWWLSHCLQVYIPTLMVSPPFFVGFRKRPTFDPPCSKIQWSPWAQWPSSMKSLGFFFLWRKWRKPWLYKKERIGKSPRRTEKNQRIWQG